jgi:S-layer protein
MLNDYANMTADATYGASATSFNAKVAASLTKSQTDGAAGGSFATADAVATTGGTYTLTAGTDLADGSGSSSGGVAKTFAFTSFNDTVNGSLGTFATADSILDDSTTDSDTMTASVNATVAATIANIENLTFSMAAGTPVVQFTSTSGATNVTVTGSVAGSLDELDTDVITGISVKNYNKVLTVITESLAGTSASSAESFTVKLEGAGSSSGITFDSDAEGAIETLNIESNGASANTTTLALTDAGGATGATNIATIAVTGSAALTLAGAHAVFSGNTLTAADTGALTLRVDRNGATTTATNLTNATGVEAYKFRDSTATGDVLYATGIISGTTITIEDDFDTGSEIVVTGSTAATTDSLTINLDNRATTATDVDLGAVTIDNVETLTINSVEAGSTTATEENSITTFNADALTSLTVLGAANLAITMAAEDQGVTVNAAAFTGELTYSAAAITKSTAVLNNVITGGSGNDTLTGATTEANTISGGAGDDTIAITDSSSNVAVNLSGGDGDDTITGGRGNDTVDGGTGDDTINLTAGTETVTGGTGDDTFVVASNDVSAVAQVGTVLFAGAWAAGDTVAVTIDSVTRTYTLTAADVSGDGTADLLALCRQVANFVNQSFSQVSATGAVATTTITAGTAGTAFTLAVVSATAGDGDDTTDDTATDNVAAYVMQTTLSDFAAGDVLDLDTPLTEGTLAYFEGAAADVATENVLVLTDAAYATVAAAEEAMDGAGEAYVIFLNSTLGYAQAYYDADIDIDAGDGNLTASVINFTGITTLTQLAAAFSTDSFIV